MTFKKFKNFLKDQQTETIQLKNRELQRFKDEIVGIKNDFIYQLENPVSKDKNFDRVWSMIITFLAGVVVGTGAIVYFLDIPFF